MKYRKFISLSILISFTVLLTTGILEYFLSHTRLVSMLHTVFGLVFSIGVAFHFKNNLKPIQKYAKKRLSIFILAGATGLVAMSWLDLPPFSTLMDAGSKLRAGQAQELDNSLYEVVELNMENDIQLTIDLLRAEHYWHPQMAIWTEDMDQNFLETVFVSKATAQGLFFGGRSKENFKSFDSEKDATGGEYRRVDALPVWSHKRGVQYSDGMFVPPPDEALPDGITGATLSENFKLHTSASSHERFRLRIEINVAFDDNEYFSEYDFPDDEEFHAGTGQLGQPSIIFESLVDMNDGKDYYLMELIGHGHHSGQDGEIVRDLSKLTTALEIVERIVVGVHGPDNPR